MLDLPSLDSHAHFDPSRSSAELAEAEAVLAMTLSLDEANKVIDRHEPLTAWGVGCHPRKLAAQQAFDPDCFAELAGRSAIIGEVGLDTVYQVPLERQLTTLRSVLVYVAKNPRIISLHSFQSTALMLDELRRNPIAAPILHWWTGTAPETRQAVELGCYFSVQEAKWTPTFAQLILPMSIAMDSSAIRANRKPRVSARSASGWGTAWQRE